MMNMLLNVNVMNTMALLQVGGSGSAPTVFMVAAAWIKAVGGLGCAGKCWDDMSGQGDPTDKIKKCWPYLAGLGLIAAPDVLGRLVGIGQGSGLMSILQSWQFTM